MTWLLEKEPAGTTLVVTGVWSPDAGELLMAGKADGLTLNYARGFAADSLDFLDPQWRLRRLDLLDRQITDLTPLERLGGSLEALSIQASPIAHLDLASLPQLHELAGEWSLLAPTAGALTELRSLITWRFGESDLHSLRDHVGLERLTLKEAPDLNSLSGIESLSALRHLQIQGAPRLSDISDLHDLASSLEELWLEECRGLGTLDEVEPLVNLRFLNIGNCGPVPSFAPLAALRRVESLYAWGTTRALDGDLTPIAELPALEEVRMRDRADYTPRLSSFVADAKRLGR